MDINGTPFGWGLVIAVAILFAFGIGYNIIVERFQQRTQRFTAELVVCGVLITVLTSGLFIGWVDVAVVLILFIASGLPMIMGSWIRAARDDEEAKKNARDLLK